METIKELIDRLNFQVKGQLSGKRINDMENDFWVPFRLIVTLPENFALGLYGLTYNHPHLDKTTNIIDFTFDIKRDKRSRITKGTLRSVTFIPARDERFKDLDVNQPIDEYIRQAAVIMIKEKMHDTNNDWTAAYKQWKADDKGFEKSVRFLQDELDQYL
jgi:hypothetical protein